MTTATITARSTHTLRLSDFPAIWRMRRVLTDHLTRIWPTRRKAITPPAMAGLSTVAALDSELLDVLGSPQSKVLTVFVPAEFREHLETIGAKCPRIRVQPDTGMTSQGAYVSWETGHGQQPLTLWVEAGVVLDALEANPMRGAQNVLPLLLVAGDTVLVSELAPDEDWRAQARAAIEAARVAPSALSALALQKAATTAEKYSERPWLFMRYALKLKDSHFGGTGGSAGNASLSDKAKAQLQNLRIAELELQRLQAQQGLIQTARAVYLNALKAELPKDD